MVPAWKIMFKNVSSQHVSQKAILNRGRCMQCWMTRCTFFNILNNEGTASPHKLKYAITYLIIDADGGTNSH